MKFRPIEKFLIMGRSGCGKSTLGRFITAMYPRVIIFDTLNEYPSTPTDIYSMDDLARFINYVEDNHINNFKVIVRFNIETDQRELIFDQMMRVFYYWGNIFIVVEEIQDYCTPHNIGKYFKFCMTSGRHKNLGFLFTTQRPALINKTVLSQSTHIFTGNLIDHNDQKAIANFIGKDSKDLATLKDQEFLWFTPTRIPPVIKINSNSFKK